MRRNISIIDSAGGVELLLPVTPSSFTMAIGQSIQTVNIHQLGDVNLSGYGTLAAITLESFFPAQNYPFAVRAQSPYGYIAQMQAWKEGRTVLRYIVSGTGINTPVLLESIEYGERDGTNDLYYTLTLREYRALQAAQQQRDYSENKSRAEDAQPQTPDTYTIQKGDTLSAIARKYYGDSSLAYKLATANDIKNPNLIYPGDSLKLPPAGQLASYQETRSGSRSGAKVFDPFVQSAWDFS